MRVQLLYFARLRESLGVGSEEAVLPEHVVDVEALTAWLRTRGGAWAMELAPGRSYRVAVNRDMAHAKTPLSEGAEVAIFPPVTGG